MENEAASEPHVASQAIYEDICQLFATARISLRDSQRKVASYIETLRSLSEEAKEAVIQRITIAEWDALLNALEKCDADFDQYFTIIDSGMDSYIDLMNLSSGNVDALFMEISAKVIELFTSVPKGVEDQMKKMSDIVEILGILPPPDES